MSIAGNPGELRSTSGLLASVGSGLGDTMSDIDSVARSTTGSNLWTGSAAEVFSGVAKGMSGHAQSAGEAFTDAATALNAYTVSLEAQQAIWQSLDAQQQQAQSELEQLQNQSASVTAANQTLTDQYDQAKVVAVLDSSKTQPTKPVLASVSNLQAQIADLEQEIDGYVRQKSQAQATVTADGDRAAYLVDQAARLSPHYKQYHKPGFWGSVWSDITGGVDDVGKGLSDVGHFAEQFGEGVVDGVGGMGKALYGLTLEEYIDPAAWARNWENLGKLAYGLTVEEYINPVQWAKNWETLGKGVIDWKDLSSGNIGKWLGNLAPTIALTVLTAGAGGAAAGGADAAAEAADAAAVAADASTATAVGGAGLKTVDISATSEAYSAEGLQAAMGDSRFATEMSWARGFQAANPAFASMPTEEIAAIRGYTDLGLHADVNGALWSGDPAAIGTYSHFISAADQGLVKLPEFGGTTFRGTTLTPENLARYVPGETVTEPAFISASASVASKFPGNAEFVIESSSGRDIAQFSHFSLQEQEVLFRPGSQFEVLSVSQAADGKTIINLAQVG